MNDQQKRLCAMCKGKCCKEYAGAYSPDDLQPITVESLRELFATTLYSVDWYEGDPREGHNELPFAYFIRPAHIGINQLKDPSWGGRCIHLGSAGCKLSPKTRPKGCRDLNPTGKETCDGQYSKKAAGIAWLPFEQVIKQSLASRK